MFAEIWKQVFATHPDPLFLIDCHADALYDPNQAVLNQLGYTREAFLKLAINDLCPPEYNPGLQSFLHLHSVTHDGPDQWRFKLASGQMMPYQVNCQRIEQDDRIFVCVRLKDSATVARERLLGQLTEQMPGIMHQLEILPDGQPYMSYVSDAVRQIMGIEPQTFAQDPCSIYPFILPQDLERVKEQHERALLIGLGWQMEYRICHPVTQQIRWIYGQAVPKQEQGKTIWYGYLTDITEHIHLQDSLQASNERLHLAREIAGIGIWELDLASGVITWDPQMYRIYEQAPTLGKTGEPLSLSRWQQLLYFEDQALLPAAVNVETLLKESPSSLRFRILARNGMFKHIEMQCSLLYNRKHQAYKIIGINRDITRMVHTQEYLQHAKIEQEKINFQLRERLKELTLMHNVAKLLQAKSSFTLSVLHEMIDLMPPGWLYPEVCVARICWGDYVAMSEHFQETSWKLTRHFESAGIAGQIDIVYLEQMPERDEGPFMQEECALLDSMTEMLQIYLEQQSAIKALIEHEKKIHKIDLAN